MQILSQCAGRWRVVVGLRLGVQSSAWQELDSDWIMIACDAVLQAVGCQCSGGQLATGSVKEPMSEG
eukprot:2275684-Rhodomonas_salina.1